MKKIIFLSIIMLSGSLYSQMEPLTNYIKFSKREEDTEFSVFKLKGKEYHLSKDSSLITQGHDTVFTCKTDDIIYYTINKKRYLFVSFYPKEQKGTSIGFKYRKLRKVDVIDLRKAYQKWSFDFSPLSQNENTNFSLGDILEFDLNTESIIFYVKLSIDNQLNKKYLTNDKNDTQSY